MSHVRGPFIEYECTACGATVQANAPRDRDKLVDEIADLNADPKQRICAGCWRPEEQAIAADDPRRATFSADDEGEGDAS
jgi:hypothetical protein